MNTNGATPPRAHFDKRRLVDLVERVFQGYSGSLGVRLWDGLAISLGRDMPTATIIVHTAKALRELVRRPEPLRLAQAYCFGEIDVEGDLYDLLKQRTLLQSLTVTMRDRLSLFSAALFTGRDSPTSLRFGGLSPCNQPYRKHSKTHNREAIAFHYDVSNAFYRLWLDEQMVYSCAYFNEPRESLEQAQRNKLDHICRKLRRKAGEQLLDIGCGWRALICWAAQHYGVRAHGITLSRQQYEYTQTKICDLGIENQVSVELRHYRDMPDDADFDKVSSIGMFEHVG